MHKSQHADPPESHQFHYPQGRWTHSDSGRVFIDYQDMDFWSLINRRLDRGVEHHLRNFLPALLITLTILLGHFYFPPSSAAYVNPSSGLPHAGRVLRPFDKPEKNWLPGHRGVDLHVEIGADIFSAGDGVVAFVGIVVGTPTVSIDHPDGIRTTYQPVHASVSVGDPVVEKQKVGTLGHPTTPYPGLQWGAKVGDDYINPIGLLPAPIIRLKPLMPAGVPA